MPRKLITADQFVTLAHAAQITGGEIAPEGTEVLITRDAAGIVDLEASVDRTISYLFSDQSVARDGHTVRTAGFELDHFRSNSVFLWAHDASAPPIGRVSNIRTVNNELVGDVEYITREIYPFADMIFQMVKQRFLNAVSISWKALEWKFPVDKARQGGVDFLRQDLLEVSQVPVPALATALATARKAGIDTAPMRAWAEKVLDDGSMIMVPRSELEKLRSVANGDATVTTVVVPTPKKRKFSRDLWQVGMLACTILDLDWYAEYAEWEKEIEGDDSDVPDRLAQLVKDACAILIDMTAEEVAELLAEEGDEVDDGVMIIEMSAKSKHHRALGALMSFARKPKTTDNITVHIDAVQTDELKRLLVNLRAGKKISADNKAVIQQIKDHADAQSSLAQSLITQAEDPNEVDPAAVDKTAEELELRAMREREAEAYEIAGRIV